VQTQICRIALVATGLLIANANVSTAVGQQIELFWNGSLSYKVGDTITPQWNILLDGDPPPNQEFTLGCCNIGSDCDSYVDGPNGFSSPSTVTAGLTSIIANNSVTFPAPGQYTTAIIITCTWVIKYTNGTVRKIPLGNPLTRTNVYKKLLNVSQ
jgi:hypothetical protein